MTVARTDVPLTINGELDERQLWHVTGREIALGCTRCIDQNLCGGLSASVDLFSCLDLCCGKPESCKKFACPNSQERYSKLLNEVGGFALRPYKRPVVQPKALPFYVPYMQDAGCLAGPVSLPIVAVSLYTLIDPNTGLARFRSKREVLEHYKIGNRAKLVITATHKDKFVERFWSSMRPKDTAESLRRLRPAIVGTPNFSMHLGAPRHDNMLSMSRIAECFEAFAAARLPVALHVNGRTSRDFERWAEYLRASPDVRTITYEFGTQSKSSLRRAWHAEQLAELASNVPRELTLMLRAGSAHIAELSSVFSRIVLIDTNPNMQAKFRKQASLVAGRVEWSQQETDEGEPVDELLSRNVVVCRRVARSQVQCAT